MHHTRHWAFRLLASCVTMGVIMACTLTPPSPTPAPPTATPVPLSPTFAPTIASASPTATPVPPTSTPLTPTPTPTSMQVQIFLIALEDNGQSGKKIGCDDSVVPVTVEVPYTQGVLRAALEELLSLQEQFYGQSGLYNSLYQSDLQVQGVIIENGKATVNLTGTMMLGGVCDNPRVEAQIEETALQFSTVSEVAVFVNGVPLEDLLSQQG